MQEIWRNSWVVWGGGERGWRCGLKKLGGVGDHMVFRRNRRGLVIANRV